MRANLTMILAVAFLLGAVAPAANAAKAPIGKTYFVVTIGVASDESEAYELGAGCIRFTRASICDPDDCGTWWWIKEEKKAKKQWMVGYEFDLIDDETGLPVTINGIGRIDSRGPKSSLAGAAHGVEQISGEIINFAIAGRAVGAARCEQLVAEFEESR